VVAALSGSVALVADGLHVHADPMDGADHHAPLADHLLSSSR
jgi:hypothetical protein